MRENTEFTYRWGVKTPYSHVTLQDESLRDGLQAPYVQHPTIEQKKTLLYLMDEIGIQGADIGFPGSGPRHFEDVLEIAKYRQQHNLSITLSCAGRTVEEDVIPIIEASQASGYPIEADLFIGSSEIRKIIQDWDLDYMKGLTEKSITLAVKEGLPVMFVTEDTTRAHPDTLKDLYEVAIEAGAKRLCISDTVGDATPDGAKELVKFFKEEIVKGRDIRVDWHGHRDLGNGLANSMAAAASGVDRVHGTALGIGERSGNTEMHLLLVHFNREGIGDFNLSSLREYSHFASEIFNRPIPTNEPIIGQEAFGTASGVHAAAIKRAMDMGRPDLAGLVYSSIDPNTVGQELDIRVGPMSGKANVELALKQLNLPITDEAVEKILNTAKTGSHILSEIEIKTIAEKLLKP